MKMPPMLYTATLGPLTVADRLRLFWAIIRLRPITISVSITYGVQ